MKFVTPLCKRNPRRHLFDSSSHCRNIEYQRTPTLCVNPSCRVLCLRPPVAEICGHEKAPCGAHLTGGRSVFIADNLDTFTECAHIEESVSAARAKVTSTCSLSIVKPSAFKFTTFKLNKASFNESPSRKTEASDLGRQCH
ncbi:hypothetical protein HPB52_023671 [Rhipicephalus sanguineus]|uniref:Uncharacterized protein n=1 Tax=Rhipicephalus sanguineus TaxID=34632 RepID=A0A9D4PE20_RHISA|nr:hypothetical protein HPB52_023671 [Rhipicephalus sanguineus]